MALCPGLCPWDPHYSLVVGPVAEIPGPWVVAEVGLPARIWGWILCWVWAVEEEVTPAQGAAWAQTWPKSASAFSDPVEGEAGATNLSSQWARHAVVILHWQGLPCWHNG